MSLVQTLDFEFQEKEGKQPAIFNPFTGEKLVAEDPYEDPGSNFSDTVMLVYAVDYISDGLYYSHADFDAIAQEELEDEEALHDKIKALDDDFHYLILRVAIYGNDPRDYGGAVFIIRG
jgi:hypothetical protein